MGKKQKLEELAKSVEFAKSGFKELSNSRMLERVIMLSSGDDYDNCFTAKGAAIYGAAKEELKNRLVENKFLSTSDNF